MSNRKAYIQTREERVIVIENEDKVIKESELFTRYEDTPDTVLDELKCPICNKDMDRGERNTITGQNTSITEYYFSCDDCCLEFRGKKSRKTFKSFLDFYYFVEEKVNDGCDS